VKETLTNASTHSTDNILSASSLQLPKSLTHWHKRRLLLFIVAHICYVRRIV